MILEYFNDGTLVCEQKLVRITRQLERDEFVRIKNFFDDYRGIWSKKHNAFEFVIDFEPMLNRIQNNQSVPTKQTMNFFPTPRKAWNDITGDVILFEGMKILEPSCGVGDNVEMIREWLNDKSITDFCIDVVELCEINRDILKHKNIIPIHDDFLSYETSTRYDLIIMNPPFNVKGDSIAWFTHLKKAYSLLSNHGEIFAIIPRVIGNERASIKSKQDAINWTATHCRYVIDLPRGVFAESGTMIETQLISIRKLDYDGLMNSHCGYSSFFSFDVCLAIDCDYELYKQTKSLESFKNTLTILEKQFRIYLPPTEIENAWNDLKSTWE